MADYTKHAANLTGRIGSVKFPPCRSTCLERRLRQIVANRKLNAVDIAASILRLPSQNKNLERPSSSAESRFVGDTNSEVNLNAVRHRIKVVVESQHHH